MFVAVKFSPADKRSYTYEVCEVALVRIGDTGYVQTKDGTKSVVVVAMDVPEPAFECKPITFTPPEAVPKAGHNNPPDTIDEALAPYGDYITEAESWLDGEVVETEGQMKAVDALTKQIKAAIKDVKSGEEGEAKPVYDQWKGIKARWKPTIDDLSRIRDGLVSIVSVFKKQLAAEKQEAEDLAWEKANAAQQEAEAKAATANDGDIEDQREAAAAKHDAIDAEIAAKAAKADKPKGMRTVHKYEIEDDRAALHWIAKNDKPAVADFIAEYVRRNRRDQNIDGVKTWDEKEAF